MGRFLLFVKRMLKFALHGQPSITVEAAIYTQQPSQRLQGRKILITGGAGGLGKAMAKRFIDEGAEVVITGRNKEKIVAVAEELGCKYLVADLQDVNSLESLIVESAKLLNGLNVLVNNAGVSLHEWEIENVTVEGWNQQFDTNLRAPYFLTKYFIRYLTKNSIGGNILFVSSERSQTVDIIPYGLTKAAMNSLVQGLAKKYINKGIRVNAIAPGVTASDMTGFKKDSNLYCSYNQTGRAYLPEEVAEAATFLISDCSNCISGQILVCNEAKTINSYF